MPRRGRIRELQKVRLIDVDGQQIGIVSSEEALSVAKQVGLDLVEVAPDANPPVYRIVDYGKYKYRQQKREKARKHGQETKTKVIKLRPAIAEHDYEFKKQHAEDFLCSGDKVMLTVVFRGRERTHPELGRQLLKRMSDELSEMGEIASPLKMQGYTMSVMLTPSSAGA
jgi:translation initiation factor IF-3